MGFDCPRDCSHEQALFTAINRTAPDPAELTELDRFEAMFSIRDWGKESDTSFGATKKKGLPSR